LWLVSKRRGPEPEQIELKAETYQIIFLCVSFNENICGLGSKRRGPEPEQIELKAETYQIIFLCVSF
jgi:hypothetical protein